MTSPGMDSEVSEGGASKSQSESITSQPTANGTVPYGSEGETSKVTKYLWFVGLFQEVVFHYYIIKISCSDQSKRG